MLKFLKLHTYIQTLQYTKQYNKYTIQKNSTFYKPFTQCFSSSSLNILIIFSCPGHFKSDCEPIDRYIFYLAFENSMCHEYITEKVYYNAYAKGAIPVIMGPSIEDCEILLPPFSYIHVNQFKDPEELSKKLIDISKNEDMLMSYHRWRNHFKVLNEHGYFNSYSMHYCRLCEALNYNSEEPKVYNETHLKQFLDRKISCSLKLPVQLE